MNNIEQKVIESNRFKKSRSPHFQQRRIYVLSMYVNVSRKFTYASISLFPFFISWTLKDFNIERFALAVEKDSKYDKY